ncbi:hypothetical protein [Microlunatus parietis]|uniref:Uncharacterized protein n=1 Tax=Microlunatus parietis TaxID=682979 RepID=A0A7Y9I7K3_9ACTN|nr:hypothetical protein [Microlunatus parietis]NYE71573.1 hypothetical protein [Microlunatus parietis]
MTRAEVLDQARRYATADSLQCSIDATAHGPRAETELIADFLADANPYPDGTVVEVLDRLTGRWEPAVIIDRAWPNEWQIDFHDTALGRERADHTQIRYPTHAGDGRPRSGSGSGDQESASYRRAAVGEELPRGRRSR